MYPYRHCHGAITTKMHSENKSFHRSQSTAPKKSWGWVGGVRKSDQNEVTKAFSSAIFNHYTLLSSGQCLPSSPLSVTIHNYHNTSPPPQLFDLKPPSSSRLLIKATPLLYFALIEVYAEMKCSRVRLQYNYDISFAVKGFIPNSDPLSW